MTKPLEPGQKKGKSSKLKEMDVRRIREMHANGTQSVKEMAQFYGVGAETIRRLLRGETWNDLSLPVTRTPEELDRDAAASYEKFQRLLAAERERRGAGDRMLEELKSNAGITPRSPLDE